MTLTEIAKLLKENGARISLAYAFNATGKTQLCVAYKDATKNADGTHTGVYYNAFSEDLFVWDNDEENDGRDVRLTVRPSSLSKFHASLTEDNVREKLRAYNPKYDFSFTMNQDAEKGLDWISFFIPDPNPDIEPPSIKISRGEERIFVWCFFLALFEVQGWADKQSSHFFIDDPVSSLDDHNIFITAAKLFDLIEDHHEKRQIIITTHHIGLYCILKDMLKRGEKAQKYDKRTRAYILHNDSGVLTLQNDGQEVMLYHLRLLQILMKAKQSNDFRAFHFALLRQLLENVASFLGTARVAYVLERIGINDAKETMNIVNTLSHKKVYYYESDLLKDEPRRMLESVLDKLQAIFHFELHLE